MNLHRTLTFQKADRVRNAVLRGNAQAEMHVVRHRLPFNDGFQQCYNAQVAVDGAHQLVVATEVTANASDQGGVPALLDALAATGGEQPETVLADAGYSNERDLAGPGNARHRRVCVLGPGGEGGQAPRPGGSIPRRVAWPRSCRGRRAVRRRQNASGCRRLPTAGSRTCWDSDASACGGWRRCRASGTWCAGR